jgi:hypothetical protein
MSDQDDLRRSLNVLLIEVGALKQRCEDSAAEKAKLTAEVARLEAALAWQPITTAPKDYEGPPILTWDGAEQHWTTRGFTAEGHRAGWFDERGWLIHPTHWMPLPSPPAQEREP